MNVFEVFFSNKTINIVAMAWFIAQAAKVVIVLITSRKLDFKRLVGSGGMPSSHASTVVSLAACVALKDGITSTSFALAFFFAIVVMYDAAGVRHAAGKQAKILNRIMDDLWNHKGEEVDKKLKELIGHTPVEVFVGALLGLAIALLLW